jgi:hypothetical protein
MTLMNRREAVKTTVAATAALPILGQTPKPAFAPRILTPAQVESVDAFIDILIPTTDTPGAKAAGVTRYIDLFLADGDERQKSAFLSGLNWLESYCQKTYQRTFAQLSPDQQTSLMSLISTSQDEALRPGAQFFRNAKAFTARLYYATQAGFDELNKFGIPVTPGCYFAE